MSERQIDHIVLAVHDLDAAAATYEALGFTLTPRAQHAWGTANRLIQFPDKTFIELLEVDRPELIPAHRPDESPPQFSFGRYLKDYLAGGEGVGFLVLSGNDSRGDAARFTAAGLGGYAPFDFERQATQPDGSKVTVGFSLAFATSQEMPRSTCFTCHNRFPENFWKPQFQRHANAAEGFAEVVMVAASPHEQRGFFESFTGSPGLAEGEGLRYACGPHSVSIMTPQAFTARFSQPAPSLDQGPRFAALVLAGTGSASRVTPAAEAHGLTIAWDARRDTKKGAAAA